MNTVVKSIVFLVLLGIAGHRVAAEEPGGGSQEAGYLGALLGAVPDVLKVHLGVDAGAFVEEVVPGGPAEKAGLRRYDVIVSAGHEGAVSPEELRALIRSRKPGDGLTLGVQRGPHRLEVAVTIGSLPAETEKPAAPKVVKPGFLGVAIDEVSPVLAAHLGLAEGAGVLVLDSMKESPAAKAGVGRNDVLVALDGYDIKGPEDFRRLLGERQAGEKVSLEWIQRGSKKTTEVTLDSMPEGMSEAPGAPRSPGAGSARRRLPGQSLPWGQHLERRGKIVIQGPDGKEHVFELPEIPWDADDMGRRLEKEIEKVKELARPDEIQRRLRALLRKLDGEIEGWGTARSGARSSHHSSEARVVEEGYDISVRNEDGRQTVTVRQGEKTLAEDLPWSRLGTLPDDVRARVEKVGEKLREKTDEPGLEPPAPEPPPAPTLRA